MGKTYGWMGKILRINLCTGDAQMMPTSEFAEKFIGGRGFLSKIYWDEVDSKIEALHPNSSLMLLTGPLAGTSAIACSRWIIGGKSPLMSPDQFGLGNLGGNFGAGIKSAGLDGIIVTGKSPKPTYLFIHECKTEIKDAGDLWGCETALTLKRLRSEHGKMQYVCIGPAGEKLVRFATVTSNNGSSGGSGFGAVMGSKNLKAVVVGGSNKVSVARPDELKKVNGRIRSFIEGRFLMDPTIEDIELVKRTPCIACPVACPRGLYKHVSGKEEYLKNCQSSYMYSPWDQRYNKGRTTTTPFLATSLCNQYGLCTQEMSNLLNWLYECSKQGFLTDDDTGVPLSQIGSLEFIETLVNKIISRDGFGDMLAEGTIRASYTVGQGTEKLINRIVTRSSFNANTYNPRYFNTNAVFYATESTSAITNLHEVIFPIMFWSMWFSSDGVMSQISTEVLQNIARKFWKSEKAVDFSTYEGKAETAYIIQNREYAKDNLVACDCVYPLLATPFGSEDFVGDPTFESQLLSAVTGLDYDEEEHYRTGERIFNLQRAIQGIEGREGRKDDKINEFNFNEGFDKEEGFFEIFNPDSMLPGPDGEVISRKGAVVERDKFEKMMDEYYKLRSWDVTTGLQKKDNLEDLGLSEIIPELQKKGLVK